MQVIAPRRATLDRADLWAIGRALGLGGVLVAAATMLAYGVFGTGVLAALTPDGRATSGQLASGALAWIFGLTAPAAFGILGVARVASAVEGLSGRRLRSTPAYRARREIGPDHVIARWVPLPDGSGVIPEIVIGPFGAAVIEELPPPGSVVAQGPRSWEIRVANGRTHLVDQPLVRASRSADRVRTWFCGDDTDHVVKVYAAVVGSDSQVTRSPTCASITPDQIGAWLTSLPVQRSFDQHRRERILRMIRAAN